MAWPDGCDGTSIARMALHGLGLGLDWFCAKCQEMCSYWIVWVSSTEGDTFGVLHLVLHLDPRLLLNWSVELFLRQSMSIRFLWIHFVAEQEVWRLEHVASMSVREEFWQITLGLLASLWNLREAPG